MGMKKRKIEAEVEYAVCDLCDQEVKDYMGAMDDNTKTFRIKKVDYIVHSTCMEELIVKHLAERAA